MVLETATILAIISLVSTFTLGSLAIVSKIKSSKCGFFECERGVDTVEQVLDNAIERQDEILEKTIENLSKTHNINKMDSKKSIEEIIDLQNERFEQTI